MNGFRRSARDCRLAALLAALGFAGIAAFEVALAAGVPWGHAAWGGAHSELSTAEDGKRSLDLRLDGRRRDRPGRGCARRGGALPLFQCVDFPDATTIAGSR
jgi:hypothetical protein